MKLLALWHYDDDDDDVDDDDDDMYNMSLWYLLFFFGLIVDIYTKMKLRKRWTYDNDKKNLGLLWQLKTSFVQNQFFRRNILEN